MKVENIYGHSFDLLFSIGAQLMYENNTGKSLLTPQIESYNSVVDLSYSFVLWSGEQQIKNFVLSRENYIKWLDENNCLVFLNKFTVWFLENWRHQQDLANKVLEDEKEEKEKKPTKKQKNS